MGPNRTCSKTSCQGSAVATLTYNYADSTVVLGPLSRLAEPHTYDLCRRHAQSMTAPKGWELLRLELPPGEYRPAEPDDLLAVAHAVQAPLQSRTHGQFRAPEADQRQPERTESRGSSVDRSVRSPQDDAPATPERTSGAQGGSTARSERPEPLGVDGPARPGRPPLRLLKDPEAK
ncbi:DUF3499 domain-containing protein [Micrococcus terreus]|nr:DUF3499 domain-containing protein [Micrococcus terreus]MCT2089443.1 DUF3499 domain-containing protein [Micrococcus terreus]MDK7700630.1 DUF3499 domain-containing protein [Micrococcus terreus]WOO97683.1 DUF3499 domain-containing protein [Micrococcus terreus]